MSDPLATTEIVQDAFSWPHDFVIVLKWRGHSFHIRTLEADELSAKLAAASDKAKSLRDDWKVKAAAAAASSA